MWLVRRFCAPPIYFTMPPEKNEVVIHYNMVVTHEIIQHFDDGEGFRVGYGFGFTRLGLFMFRLLISGIVFTVTRMVLNYFGW
jgi:hypothetical protein